MTSQLDPKNAKVTANCEFAGSLFAMCHDVTGGKLYGAGTDYTVHCVDLSAEKPAAEKKWTNHDSYVSTMVFVDGVVISGGFDQRLIWTRADSGEKIREVFAHDGWVRDATVLDGGRQLVSVGDDMLVKLWDIETGELLRSLNGHEKQTPQGYTTALYAIAASPDGKIVASGDRIGEVCLWQVDSGKLMGRLKVPTFYTYDAKKRVRSIGGIRSLRFSPDGSRLAIAGIGQVTNVDGFVGPCRVELWDWQAKKRVYLGQDSHKAVLNDIAFHPTQSWLVGGGGGDSGGILAFWEQKNEKLLHKAKFKGHMHRFFLMRSAREYTLPDMAVFKSGISKSRTPKPRRNRTRPTDNRIEALMRIALVCICFLALAQTAHDEPWKRRTIDNSSRGADGVRLADVNGDGLMDIATGWEEGGVIRAYINPGPKKSRQPWPAVSVGRVKSPEDAVFADLDGDGAFEVVSSCEGRNRTVYVHWAPTDKESNLDANAWKTEPIPATQGKQMWMFCLPMQIDGHDGIDLVVGSKGGGATISWLQSPADPRDLSSWNLRPLYKAGWIMSLQVHDMDGDGDLDLLASDRKGPNRGVLWLDNPGAKAAAEGATWNEHKIGGHYHENMFLTVADLGRDKRRGILCAARGRGFSLFRATSKSDDPWQHVEIEMPTNCGTGKGVAVGDINADGRNDIVFTCENASQNKSGVRWLSYEKQASDRIWKDHEISGPMGVKFDRVDLLDLDGDGDLDVITCEERNNLGVIWYENPTR